MFQAATQGFGLNVFVLCYTLTLQRAGYPAGTPIVTPQVCCFSRLIREFVSIGHRC